MRQVFIIALTIVKFLNSLLKKPPNPHTYKAKFVTETKVLSRYNYGFCLTGKRRLSIKHSYENGLVFGGTGSGKSSVVLIPSILSMKGNMVIHDPSGELYQQTAGHLYTKGYQVLCLNFTNPDMSIGFNPLKHVHNSSDAGKLATLLIQTSLGVNSESFWNLQAISLMTTAIELILPEPVQLRTLKSVQSLLQSILSTPDTVLKYAEAHPIERVRKSYHAFAGLEEKLRTNILATALASLTALNDEIIAQVTSVDTWDMQSLRTGKVAVFVQNPLTERDYLSALTSVFFETLWKYVFHALPKKTDRSVFFLIDEASSLYLPNLSLVVSNLRKYQSGLMLVWQNYNQMVHLYGSAQANTIASNCLAKLYLSGQPLDTARSLEATLGQYEFKDEEGTRHIRPLMTAPEIRMMPRSNGILICSNYPPIKTKLIPYYKQWRLRRRTTVPLPKITRRIPHNLIHLNL